MIYGPLNQAVLDWFDQDLHVDDFPDFNHTQSGGLIINGKFEKREQPALPAGAVIEGE